MELGKVTTSQLENILSRVSKKREEVVLLPKIGEDCAVINIEDEYTIISTDPITGSVNDIGALCIDINANDIYSSGGVPVGVMVTIMLPTSATEEDLYKINNAIANRCDELNIAVLGGHTEVTDAVNRPLVSVTIIGKSINKKYVTSSNIEIGDDIVVTKNIATEGTYIIANDNYEFLKDKVDVKLLDEAIGYSDFVSIKKECEIAMQHNVTGMHDVTEGGLFGAVYEMMNCSMVGCIIDIDKVSISEVTKKICEVYGINPYKLISSGSVIITCKNGDKLVSELVKNGVQASVIGKATENKKVYYKEDEKLIEIGEPEKDEVYKV